MLNISKYVRRGPGHLASRVTGLASLMALVLVSLPAQASVTLTRADVEALLNRVEFIPRGRQARSARMSDVLAVGDALRTASASRADLRFNDGSLARVGERATFRFVPNTRNFRLTNGTVLLLIPPGRGRTNIQTPSAVTGIQGSAVVVRYIPDSDLTVVMALTNNPAGPMTITANSCGGDSTACGATEYSLYGGQMALIQNNQVQVVEFDLPTFYQTSPLVEGLELDDPNADSPLGPDLEAVREETLEALEEQAPFRAEAVTLNPALIGLDGTNQIASEQPWVLSPANSGSGPISILRGVLTPGIGVVTNIFPAAGQAANPRLGGGSGLNPGPGNNNGVGPGNNNGVGVGVGGDPGNNNGVGPGNNNGVGVGVGGDPGNNNGVGPGNNNGVGVGVGGDPGNNNGVGPGNNNGVGPGNNNGVGVGVGGDPGNNNGVGPGNNNGVGPGNNNGVGVGVGGDPGNNNGVGPGNNNGVGPGNNNGVGPGNNNGVGVGVGGDPGNNNGVGPGNNNGVGPGNNNGVGVGVGGDPGNNNGVGPGNNNGVGPGNNNGVGVGVGGDPGNNNGVGPGNNNGVGNGVQPDQVPFTPPDK